MNYYQDWIGDDRIVAMTSAHARANRILAVQTGVPALSLRKQSERLGNDRSSVVRCPWSVVRFASVQAAARLPNDQLAVPVALPMVGVSLRAELPVAPGVRMAGEVQ